MSDLSKDEIMQELDARSVNYDKRAKKEDLYEMLVSIGSNNTNEVKQVANVEYLKNPVTGRIFQATETLKKNGSLQPATEQEYKKQG